MIGDAEVEYEEHVESVELVYRVTRNRVAGEEESRGSNRTASVAEWNAGRFIIERSHGWLCEREPSVSSWNFLSRISVVYIVG